MPEICCTCHRPGSSEEAALVFDLEVAQSALNSGDLGHARHHVAGALGQAPTDPRAHAVFEALAERMDLTRVPESAWFGEFAMTAFALYRAGRRSEAIRILSEVTRVAPHLGYEHVLTGWLTGLSGGTVDDEVSGSVASALMHLSESTIGFNRLRPGERVLLAPLAGLADVFAQLDLPDASLLAPASGVLRRSGRVAAALALARRTPGVPGRVQEGLALRAMGEGAKAHDAFLAATAEAGEAGSYVVDQARCQYVAGCFTEALALLDGVSADDPEVEGLRRACREPSSDPLTRVARLDQLRRSTRYIALDVPPSATANMLADPRMREDKPVRTAVSGWEGPTNRLLLAVNAGHTDVRRVRYSISFKDFERPVMRQVRGAGPLWLERDGVFLQGYDAPPEDLRAALARVVVGLTGEPAAMLESLFEGARQVKSAPAQAFKAAMVHPPVEVGHDSLPRDVYRYQVACACALTALPSRDGLEALESVIFGPVDWASGASIVALGEWVRLDPAVANRGRAMLIGAVDDLIPHSCEPRFWPLFGALMHLPGVPRRSLDALRSWFAANNPKEDSEG